MDNPQNQNPEQPPQDQAYIGDQQQSGMYNNQHSQNNQQQTNNSHRQYKSAAAAGWLSIMPGMGQIYLGYYQRGFIHILICATLITALSHNAGSLAPLLGIFLSFFWVYNIIDASRRAALVNRAIAGLHGSDLPDDFKMPGAGGGMGTGIILTVMGFLIFMSTKFDMSLDWLEEWWPLALVAGGIYLIRKNINKNR